MYTHAYTHTHTHTHTHTMEYYSAIKENEILPFAAMWVGLENTKLAKNKSISEHSICIEK